MRITSTKRIVLIIVSIILIILIGFLSYFYLALSGNPISRWSQNRTCVTYYEKTYGIDFTVYQSSYSYKRHAFEFKVGPTDRPEIFFSTSVDALDHDDGYGPRLVGYYIEKTAESLLTPQYGKLSLIINAFEQSDPLNKTETDPLKRLTQNSYSLFVRWEDSLITREKADAIVAEMSELMRSNLAGSTNHLDFHVMIMRKNTDAYSYFIPIK